LGKGRQEKARQERRFGTVRMVAYLLTVHADAWGHFCAELRIDGDVLLKDLPGYDTAGLAEGAARLLAFSAAEAAAWLRRPGKEAAQVLTVESVVASLRELLDPPSARQGGSDGTFESDGSPASAMEPFNR
jgi:hypothetical protein